MKIEERIRGICNNLYLASFNEINQAVSELLKLFPYRISKTDLGKTLFYEDKKGIKHPILICFNHIGLTLKETWIWDEISFRPPNKIKDFIHTAFEGKV